MDFFKDLAIKLFVSLSLFFGGFFTHDRWFQPDPVVQWKTEVETKIVYRNYSEITKEACVEKLICYDTNLPKLDAKQIDPLTWRIDASLCEREWSRDLIIVGKSENWKYGIGAVVGVAGVVGLLYLVKAVK